MPRRKKSKKKQRSKTLKSLKKERQALAKERKLKAKREKKAYPFLTHRLKRWLGALLIILAGLIIGLSFFGLAGRAGEKIFDLLVQLLGRTVFFLPIFFFLAGFLVLKPQKKRVAGPVALALVLLTGGICGFLASQNQAENTGGALGELIAWPFFNYFGLTVALIVFGLTILIGGLILWEFLPKRKKSPIDLSQQAGQASQLTELQKPTFEVKPIEALPDKAGPGQLKAKKCRDRQKPAESSPEPCSVPLPHPAAGQYKTPPLALFDTAEEKPSGGNIEQNAAIIRKTLLNFGIEVSMAEVNVGPTVAQYTLKPAEGVKLSKLTALNNDLALALAAHPIRIEAPIPGRSLVGIEVPNKQRALVKVGNLVGLPQFIQSGSYLALTLGRDVMGQPILPSLDRMPHLLVAGATGSGKTIALNSLIVSLIARNSPKILRFILIDPKRVEFPVYTELPHLLTPVIFNPQKAVNALNWLVGEMERRFDILKEAGSRDIIAYNKQIEKQLAKDPEIEPMPYIVLIIDELADLMMSKGKEVESAIVRISQLARAVGIHLVVATQRPSVEVITGLIKANITSRVAFQVASQVDSRTILDCAGAEKLLGRGDMLYLSSEFSKPKRIQGSFLSSAEIKKVVKFIIKENASAEKEDLTGEEQTLVEGLSPSLVNREQIDLEDDSLSEPLYNQAKEVVVEYRKASASLLQRRLRIGYARAARILDLLEANGLVGPQEGSRPRKVYFNGPSSRDENDDGYIDAGEVESEYK